MPEHGCAQDADGNLLSPSKIVWYNDVDDDVPMPASSGGSSSSKLTTLDQFFIPTEIVAGARRSGRTTRPSTKILDPDNAESHTFFASAGVKRKANPIAHAQAAQLPPRLRSRSAARSIHDTDADSQDEGKTDIDTVDLTEKASSDVEKASTDEDDIEVRYECTKALGDADRKVNIFHILKA